MRASDLVEPVLGTLPHFWQQIVVFVALTVMTVFEWWTPVVWFVQDVGSEVTDTWLPVFQSVVDRFLE